MAAISWLVWACTDSMNRSAIQPEPRIPHRKMGASLGGAIRDAGRDAGTLGIEVSGLANLLNTFHIDSMRKVNIPKTNLHASTLALGTDYFGSTVSRELSMQLVDKYFEAGGNVIDTA